MSLDATEIHVQVVPSGLQVGEFASPVVERLVDRISDVQAAIDAVARRVALDLTAMSDRDEKGWGLDEVGLEFSLDLEAEAGVVVARATTTAAFTVSLTWTRSSPGDAS